MEGLEGFADGPASGFSDSRPASSYPTGSPMGRPMTGVGGSRPASSYPTGSPMGRPMTGVGGSRPVSSYPTGSPMGRPMTGVGGSRPVSGISGPTAGSPAPGAGSHLGQERPMTGQHFAMDDVDFPAQQVGPLQSRSRSGGSSTQGLTTSMLRHREGF